MSRTESKASSADLLLFDEQDPNAAQYWPDRSYAVAFRSECPPDTKFKVENLFQFKRKRGDLLLSGLMLMLALFFLVFFCLCFFSFRHSEIFFSVMANNNESNTK